MPNKQILFAETINKPGSVLKNFLVNGHSSNNTITGIIKRSY